MQPAAANTNVTYIRSPIEGTRSTLLPPPAIHIIAASSSSSSEDPAPASTMTVDTTTTSAATVTAAVPTAAAPRRRSPSSDFDLSLLPVDRIFKRTLMPWSVHYSVTTGKWIATISRREGGSNSRLIQLFFRSEKEARKFCKTYSPPKICNSHNGHSRNTSSSLNVCRLCQASSSNSSATTRVATATRHCRNCGVAVCDACSTRWGSRMVPKTYMSNSSAMTLRVCRSCDWLSNAFCMALLQGRYQDAVKLQETGNVNLRTCFADIHREAMFPIHCAVMGGSLQLVKWLVDTHLVPISVAFDRKKGHMLSVQTSGSRTLLDLAMTGRTGPKVDILCYLVSKGLSATDVKDPELIPKTLEAILRAGGCFPPPPPRAATPPTTAAATDTDTPSAIVIPLENTTAAGTACHMDTSSPPPLEVEDDEADETTTCMDDACCLCYERPMDCVLVPCGHQMCCAECAEQLSTCPLCKTSCSVLRVFRQ